MQSTVQQPLPAQSFDDSDYLVSWMNYQGLEFLRQLRLAMNFEFHAATTISTPGTGIVTTAWTSLAMPTGSAWSVDVKVTARATDSSGVDGRVDLCGLFSRQAGGAAQTGATMTLVSIGPHLCTLVASGSGVLVRVQDNAAHPVDWSVDIRVREAT